MADGRGWVHLRYLFNPLQMAVDAVNGEFNMTDKERAYKDSQRIEQDIRGSLGDEYADDYRKDYDSHADDDISEKIGGLFDTAQDAWDDYTGTTQTEDTNQANKDIAHETNEYNYKIAQETNALNKEIAQGNLQFQKEQQKYEQALQQKIFEREDSSYQRTVADMTKAGLNPLTMNGTNNSGQAVARTPQHNDMQYIKPDGAVAPTMQSNASGKREAINNVIGGIGVLSSSFNNSVKGLAEFGDRQDRKKAAKIEREKMEYEAKMLRDDYQFLQDNYGGSESAFEYDKMKFGITSQKELEEFKAQKTEERQKAQFEHETQILATEIGNKLLMQDKQLGFDEKKLSKEDAIAWAKLRQDASQFDRKQKNFQQELLQKYEELEQNKTLTREKMAQELKIWTEEHITQVDQFKRKQTLAWTEMLLNNVAKLASAGLVSRKSFGLDKFIKALPK